MKGKPIEPGCLAMIVGSRGCPENNGRVVRVIRAVTKDEVMPESGLRPLGRSGNTWLVEALRGTLTLFVSGPRVLQVRTRSYAARLLIRLDEGEEPKTVSTAHTKDLDEVI